MIDQELPGLAGLFEIELHARLEIFKESADRTRVLFQEFVLSDEDDQLLLEWYAIFGIEDFADLRLLFRERGERLRKHPEIDLSGFERFLHRWEWNRRDRDIGLGQPLLFKRGFQPEVTGRVEAVDADDLALQVGHRFDRRIALDVEACTEAAGAFAGNRRNHLGRHAFRRRENHAVRAAGGEVDGAGLECLAALVRASKPRRVERVGLAVVLGQIGLGNEHPQRLFRRHTIADAQCDRLPDGCVGRRGRKHDQACHSPRRGLRVKSAHVEPRFA